MKHQRLVCQDVLTHSHVSERANGLIALSFGCLAGLVCRPSDVLPRIQIPQRNKWGCMPVRENFRQLLALSGVSVGGVGTFGCFLDQCRQWTV